MQLDNTTNATIQQWLSGNYDEVTKSDIQKLINEEAHTELTDAFYKNLEFGTGGLR
jgi:phosphoglucomutase